MISLMNLLFIALYFLVVILIGLFASKQRSKDEFLIAERKVGGISLGASIAAGFMGGGLLVAYVSYIYEFGFAAFWVFIGIVLGILLLLFYYKKIKALADREEFYTISDYFKFHYGKAVGLIATLTILLYSIFFLIVEFIGGGRILAGLLSIPYSWSIVIMAVVILFYLGLGGFKSVVKTDVFQYFIILVFALVIASFVFWSKPVATENFTLSGAGFGNAFAFVILSAFASFMAPDLWQRIYAAKSFRAVRNSFYFSSLIILIFGFAITVIGLIAKLNYPDILPGDALVVGLSSLLPKALLGLGLIMLFAALMSSLDTFLFILGMNVSEDITASFRKLSKGELVSLTRWSILGFTIFAVIVSILIQNIIPFALAFGSMSLVLIPSLILGFHFKLKRNAVFLSILMGILSVLAILISGYITPETSVISLPVALVFLLLGQFIFNQ